MTGAKRTTIREVAERAGVSTKTVSRVLNNEPHVTAAVRERVNAATRELDYHPNMLAQGLVRRRSYLLGLVYEKPSPSYVVDLQMGVLDRLREERYRLIVLPVHSIATRAHEVTGLLRSAALDGVVLAPPASDHPRILRELTSAQLPFARIAPTQMLELGNNNLLDDVAAARGIANHVLAQGHRRIAIILGDPTHSASQARIEGFGQAFAEHGLNMAEAPRGQGYFTFESGFEAAQALLSAKPRPTAILAQNDDMAVGALMAARDLGLDVPGDVSIVGFDDSEVSRITWPRITTVKQPVYDMAFRAAEMLIQQLEQGERADSVVHPHTLMLRDSVAPPRR
ncbi:LacI family DNA-binding transcriptional regulator [Sphingomonas sp. FW199]|uniref:LacI family DNA-binding transcriptional regulator n=1 Tax=Sphingomonas sp. FW199 TaxID=3400217 RepID=UPI003CF04E89